MRTLLSSPLAQVHPLPGKQIEYLEYKIAHRVGQQYYTNVSLSVYETNVMTEEGVFPFQIVRQNSF